jgi:hypothetical protein
MGIRNSLFTAKGFSLTILFLAILSGCQSVRKTDVPVNQPATEVYTTTKSGVIEEPQKAPDVPTQAAVPSTTNTEDPKKSVNTKLAVILGPGGFGTYSQIGFLQGLQKSKIRIDYISGIEFGSLVAAMFAKKGQGFDVEWQMMKLEPDVVLKTSMLSSDSRAQKINVMMPFLKEAFQGSTVENSKVPFVCPALNIQKQTVFFMNRGGYAELLPFCIPMFPFFEPYQDNVANVLGAKALADHLRTKGAHKIIFVNVLPSKSMMKLKGASKETETFWNQISYTISRHLDGIDYVVQIPLGDSAFLSASQRREFIKQGQLAGQQFGEVLLTKINQQ